MAWRAAASIPVFHTQLKNRYPRAAPPNTQVVSWGVWGHPGTTSDHQPKAIAGLGANVVTACDWPHAPALGLDNHEVCEALRQSRDARIKYVIFNRRMFSSYASGDIPPFTWRRYPNADVDPHTDHGHMSVVGDARADQTHLWRISLRGDDDVAHTLIKWSGNLATFVTDGKQSWWIRDDKELADRLTLHREGLLPLTGNGAVRPVGNRALLGVIIGGLPPEWPDQPPELDVRLDDEDLAEVREAAREGAAEGAGGPTIDEIEEAVDRQVDQAFQGGKDDGI